MPVLRQRFEPDIVVANAENASSGTGLTPKQYQRLCEAGIDGITMIDHVSKKAQIVKTMVLADRDGQPVLALVPGDQRLDVKAVARVVGRPLKIMPLHRIPQATGFEVGAVAPFGLPGGPHPVVADRAIFRHPSVDISSGRHDLGLRLSSADLLALLGGAAHPITAP